MKKETAKSTYSKGKWSQMGTLELSDGGGTMFVVGCEQGHDIANVYRESDAQLITAAADMFESIGKLRRVISDKSLGIQFAGSEGTMQTLQSIFREMEMAYRKAEGKS